MVRQKKPVNIMGENFSMKICYWSIAWGEYSYMLQALVKSFRGVGMKEDFVVYSDTNIKYAKSFPLDKTIELDSLQFFKFEYLKKLVSKLDYDIFVFIDADHFFVRKPEIQIDHILKDGSPWHSFLESPINSNKTRRPDWWGIKNADLVRYFRALGVNSREIRNTNGGFWICKKDFIEEACKLADISHQFLVANNHIVPEEVSIAYISNYISADNTNRFSEYLFNYWGSDWTGAFKDKLPKNKNWELVGYMTQEKILVNPAIVHAMRSKKALVEYGRSILSN